MQKVLAVLKTIKFWAVLAGTGATAAAGVADAPPWLVTVGTVLTALGMWALPYQSEAELVS